MNLTISTKNKRLQLGYPHKTAMPREATENVRSTTLTRLNIDLKHFAYLTQSWPFRPLVLIFSELLLKIANSEEKISNRIKANPEQISLWGNYRNQKSDEIKASCKLIAPLDACLHGPSPVTVVFSRCLPACGIDIPYPLQTSL